MWGTPVLPKVTSVEKDKKIRNETDKNSKQFSFITDIFSNKALFLKRLWSFSIPHYT
jgi:hypothetical protein